MKCHKSDTQNNPDMLHPLPVLPAGQIIHIKCCSVGEILFCQNIGIQDSQPLRLLLVKSRLLRSCLVRGLYPAPDKACTHRLKAVGYLSAFI